MDTMTDIQMCIIKVKRGTYYADFQQSIYDRIECSHTSAYEVIQIFEKYGNTLYDVVINNGYYLQKGRKISSDFSVTVSEAANLLVSQHRMINRSSLSF